MMKFAFAVALATVVSAQNEKGQGFGDDYKWYDLETGLAAAKAENKPALVVHHQLWCGACKRLGPMFAKHAGIKKEADKFIMINCVGGVKGCDDKKWQPDGGYVPRIFFTLPSGEVVTSYKGPNDQYKYFYATPEDIAMQMGIMEEEMPSLLAQFGSDEL
eukprot:TRINITY_DN9316_c0_g1_i1.p1 TRINITY_DN9316_c0_g1~~TRINITY_DN9316_c0_g1_i1.p1  ORF type:complete len:160 (+),score=78.52 TRINITY_DN9316_c0_g1_i1:75-554(+)